MRFKESWLAHKLLDGLEGIEIGGSAHSPFGLNTRNVDFSQEMDTVFKKAEFEMCGEALPVDLVAPGDELPLEDSSVDFVISAHVIEHFPDPIKALKEWHRVVRPGGFIYVIAPDKNRICDKHRERTTLNELIERHTTGEYEVKPNRGHHSFWVAEDFVELVHWLKWPVVAAQDVDDKVGNGFAVAIRVEKPESGRVRIGRMAREAKPRPCPERPMSLNFIIAPAAKERTAGAATMLEFARRLYERGHDVSVTTWPKSMWHGADPFPRFSLNIPIRYLNPESGSGLPVHVLNQAPRNYLGEVQFLYQYLGMVTQALPQADLLITSHWDAVLPALQSGKGRVVHFASHFEDVRFTAAPEQGGGLSGNPLLRALCKSVFEMPVARIANSSSLARLIEKQSGRDTPSVLPGVDTRVFLPRGKRSEEDGDIRVVTYARPEPWKGFAEAMAAMEEILARHPRVQWHVFGFPPAIPADNAKAPYRFHGFLSPDRLSRLYAESDIVLCPSWQDSAPLPPLEAMACGTAVITTSGGSEDYAIESHTALVTAPRDAAALAGALERLIQDRYLRRRLARNGRSMAEGLSWDVAVERRENLLWRILQNEDGIHSFAGLERAMNPWPVRATRAEVSEAVLESKAVA